MGRGRGPCGPHECGDAIALPGDFRKEAGAVLKARGAVPRRPYGPEAPAGGSRRRSPRPLGALRERFPIAVAGSGL